ncbi:MAG: hypothetical protein PHR28_14580 [candidate division Zixibacteria bacterium]|nr:hypothetical protein [candidate division Zixibacteria bacterium]
MKRGELIAVITIVCGLLACKFLAPKPLQFSPAVSLWIIILMALACLIILYLSIKGKPIERRVVFIFVGVSLILPFFMQFRLPIKVSPEVQASYDVIAALPPGSTVLVSFDYDPPSAPELQPMADAFVKYAFEHDLKIILVGLWPQGPQQADLSVEAAFAANPALREKIRYGIDYVNLGFQSGNEFVILRMGESFKAMFPVDQRYTLYDSLPLMKNIRNFSNVDLGFNLSAGRPGTTEWVQVAVDRYHLKMTAGNTAVQAPLVYPFLKSGQIIGMLGGMTGAAEFEILTEKPGKAMTYMLSQTFAHVIVMVFIVIGNVVYFRSRKEQA